MDSLSQTQASAAVAVVGAVVQGAMSVMQTTIWDQGTLTVQTEEEVEVEVVAAAAVVAEVVVQKHPRHPQ